MDTGWQAVSSNKWCACSWLRSPVELIKLNGLKGTTTSTPCKRYGLYSDCTAWQTVFSTLKRPISRALKHFQSYFVPLNHSRQRLSSKLSKNSFRSIPQQLAWSADAKQYKKSSFIIAWYVMQIFVDDSLLICWVLNRVVAMQPRACLLNSCWRSWSKDTFWISLVTVSELYMTYC